MSEPELGRGVFQKKCETFSNMIIGCVKCELSWGGGRQEGANSSNMVFSRCWGEQNLMRIIETLESFLTPYRICRSC